MDKKQLKKLKDSLKDGEYIVPGYHPKAKVAEINKLKLTGTERKEAFIKCYVQPRKMKRDYIPPPQEEWSEE